MNETFTIDNSLVDWSMDENSDESHDADRYVISSPLNNNFNRNDLPLPSRLSSIGVNTTGKHDDSWKSFLNWLDQSISVQESLLVESDSFNNAYIDPSNQVDSSSNSSIPNVMFDHLQHMRECLNKFRDAPDGAWLKRFSPEVERTTIAMEASDILVDISQQFTERCTRSKGKAVEYPRVQSKTLEYKLRKRDS